MAEIALQHHVDIARYNREIARIPGLTAEEVLRMSETINAALSKADAAARVARAVEQFRQPTRAHSIVLAIALGDING